MNAPPVSAITPSAPVRQPWWRQGRTAAALVVLVVLGSIVIAMLAPHPRINGYLDPGNNGPDGANSVTDILGERGFQVVRAYSTAQAMAAVRAAGHGPAVAALVITSPDLLTPGQRASLARARANLVVVQPGSADLAALAPAALLEATAGQSGAQVLQPACALSDARLAGSANMGGITYDATGSYVGCYPLNGYPTLVRYTAAKRTITVLGSGFPLTNSGLVDNGNAALMLNLLAGTRTIVWLTPEPTFLPEFGRGRPASQPRSAPGLLPTGVSLLLLQLCVVVALVAVWRARRLGPLITERLPVVVQASETVEGHGRLYQSRRARDKAAAALRDAMLGRVVPVLGLAADAPQEAVAQAMARRSRLTSAEVAGLVYGPVPATDAALVDLARNLDELEREVRAQ